MPEVTVNVPISTGALNADGLKDIIWLSGKRFFAIYTQNGPNYTYGMVVEINNIKSASPSANVLRNQVLSDYSVVSTQTSAPAHRLIKLNNTQVMVLRMSPANGTNLDVAILEINETTNVITRVNTNSIIISIKSVTSAALSPLRGDTAYPEIVTYKRINATNVIVGIPGINGSGNLALIKLSWNNVTKIVSSTTLYTTSGIRGDLAYVRFYDHEDGSGITIVINYATSYSLTTAYQWGTFRLTAANISNMDSVTSLNVTGPAPTLPNDHLVSIIEDSSYVGTHYSTDSQFYKTSLVNSAISWSTIQTISGASAFSIDVSNAVSLTNNKVMLVYGHVTGSGWDFTGSTRIRIVDYKTNSCTPNTSGNINFTLYPNKLSFVEKIDNSTVVFYGYTQVGNHGSFRLYFAYIA